MLEPYYFHCPYCWQQISVTLDLSIRAQTYIEDCEVCCNPIEISYVARNNQIEDFRAEAVQSPIE